MVKQTLAALTFSALFSAVVLAQAPAPASAPLPAPSASSAKPTKYEGTVVSIDGKAGKIYIKLKNGSSAVWAISDHTKVTVSGKAATLANLFGGMELTAMVSAASHADELTITAAPPQGSAGDTGGQQKGLDAKSEWDGVIDSIDKTKTTIIIKNDAGVSPIFVSPETEILKGGKKIAFSAIQVGQSAQAFAKDGRTIKIVLSAKKTSAKKPASAEPTKQ